jgi:hypothetical protein
MGVGVTDLAKARHHAEEAQHLANAAIVESDPERRRGLVSQTIAHLKAAEEHCRRAAKWILGVVGNREGER